MYEGKITDIEGLRVGHAQDTEGLTGVTVLLADHGAVCGVDVRGSAPGTRETALLGQSKAVQQANAVLLAGGSAFGLAAADGVMEYCEQREMGVQTPFAYVPIVPAAVIYDLGYGDDGARPDAAMGYAACTQAGVDVQQGSIGAGIGATVGKILGMQYCQKGGIGTASMHLPDGSQVAALVCVNAFGDIVNSGGQILAGAKKDGEFINTERYILKYSAVDHLLMHGNTTIGIVATNVRLSKDGATKLAEASHDGLARAIIPVHTEMDGDTIFGLSCGTMDGDLNSVCVAGAEAMRRACINAVTKIRGEGAAI